MISYKGSGNLRISKSEHNTYGIVASSVFSFLKDVTDIMGQDYSDYSTWIKRPLVNPCGHIHIDYVGGYELGIIYFNDFNILNVINMNVNYISPKTVLGIWLYKSYFIRAA